MGVHWGVGGAIQGCYMGEPYEGGRWGYGILGYTAGSTALWR